MGLLVAVVGCDSSSGPKDIILAPPAVGQGFQISVPPFPVAAGTETQQCYFVTVPGAATDEVWVNRFQIAGNLGTHHMNLFRVKTIHSLMDNPDHVVKDGECWISSNWSDWPLVVNSQDGGATVDWTLPDGVGAKFAGGELLMLQIHFVNATTQKTPGVARSAANLFTMKSAPANELGTIFATNQNLRICPGETKSFETHCTAFPTDITVVAANGHFHSRGTKFTIAPADPMGNLGTVFYTSTVWNDPPMARDMSVPIPAGSSIGWTCEYSVAPTECGNPMDSCCFTFGGHVETQEHCNAFVYYYPKIQDYNCF
jgi:hypothetical protein